MGDYIQKTILACDCLLGDRHESPRDDNNDNNNDFMKLSTLYESPDDVESKSK